ncbi:uncharacterized protein EI97DRAFT_490430 [Westerdykella ornata]|uniref:Uncharacterized protein n=1 Tax=Westerdykella ornata TaxID=318751 RepID=A0A6A6JLP2_WESOR|nr:uncharacterized protein EI97DRAFT_490430 [Westerdykella ornata]KAF2276868.1 hypothetical protein EI97DRAFT_490430 [Westerdykella ornata]
MADKGDPKERGTGISSTMVATKEQISLYCGDPATLHCLDEKRSTEQANFAPFRRSSDLKGIAAIEQWALGVTPHDGSGYADIGSFLVDLVKISIHNQVKDLSDKRVEKAKSKYPGARGRFQPAPASPFVQTTRRLKHGASARPSLLDTLVDW